MKTTTEANLHHQEDNKFLSKIQGNRLPMLEVLLSAPNRLLNHPIEEVGFPKRFVNKLHEANCETLVDLIRLKFDELGSKNFGERTIEVAQERLVQFFERKIKQKSAVTLRDQMVAFCQELLAREARIFELRFGMFGSRWTLEAVGEKFGLTRERVRQIESALFATFERRYPAVREIHTNAKHGIKLGELALHVSPLLDASDPLPLLSILENLEPKLYLVSCDGIGFVVSEKPQTDFDALMKKAFDTAEDIFRGSETILTRDSLLYEMKKRDIDSTTTDLAVIRIVQSGIWIDKFLLSPNRDKANVAMGRIQISNKPIHLEVLVEEIQDLTGEITTVENLRSALSAIPLIRSFGYGMVGFKRHVFIQPEDVDLVIKYCENIVTRGPEGYQWSTKDLADRVNAKYPEVSLDHHQLNVILRDSKKLQYLGRMTFIQKGEGEERKLYREILVDVLNKVGGPLSEERLIEEVRKVRGFHPNVHMRTETEVIELLPKIWGLTRRDAPFTDDEIAALTRAFDATFHNNKAFDDEYLESKKIDTKGIRPSELLKVIEVNSERA